MISYKALTSASTILESLDDLKLYESEIFSSNGSILYPYDLDTTLTGVIYEDLKDVTNKFDDIRWTIYNSDSGKYEADEEWNNAHKGKNPITISKDEINGKAVIQFEAYKNLSGIPGDDTLVACSRISIIDTNDLLSSGLKPNSPYIGQVWIDSSTDPATMWMWNGTKWIQIGTVTAVVKNLLRNSAFYTYNYKHFDIVGDTRYSFTPTVSFFDGKKWLNLSSDTTEREHRGISQTTEDTEKIYINDTYSFQFLVKNNSKDSDKVKLNIYSINSKKQETLIYEEVIQINNDKIKSYFTTFKTLDDTTNIKVEIIGLDDYRFNFYITELAIFNTGNVYPWEPSPYDSEIEYDPEALFNALTYNGKIQGIYSMIDPKTGQLQYFFNAEYIQSGTLKGEYIDAKNLVVRRDDGVKTLEIDKHGNVNLVVNSLRISATNQTIEDFIYDKLDELTPEELKYLLYEITKDHEQVNYEYEQYYNDTNLFNQIYKGEWSEYLDKDMLNRADKELGDNNGSDNIDTQTESIALNRIKFNANKTITIKPVVDSTDDNNIMALDDTEDVPPNDTENNNKSDSGVIPIANRSFFLGEARLGLYRLGLGNDSEEDGRTLRKLLYYCHLAYEESYTDVTGTINKLLENSNKTKSPESKIITYDLDTEVYADGNNKELKQELADNYTDYSTKNGLLYKLFILCNDYITNHKITVKIDDWSNLYVESNKILEEVGQLKKYYLDDTLKGVFIKIANREITAGSIIDKVSEGLGDINDPDNKNMTQKFRETIAQQTAGYFNWSAEDYSNTMKSSFKLSTDGVMLDSNGSLISMNGKNINISSDNINLEGYVTFNKLANKNPEDTTYIDGGYIKTNSLDASSIKADTLSANQITTGTLQSKNNKSVLDLDNGTFTLGDSLVYKDGKLSFTNVTITDSTIDATSGLPEWIQKWNSTKTEISGEQIVSPRAFFGNYDPNSATGLTGIMLGIDLASRNTPGQEGLIDAGIVGYYCNEPSFRFNVDGTAQFGRDTDKKKVYIDSEGALHFGRIDGDEIDARNLRVLRDGTTTTTFLISDKGEVLIKPKTFYLYNGTDTAIKLENSTVTINADYITTGKMSAGCLDVTDGSFIVKDTNGNTTFSIDTNSNVTINPSTFNLYSTNGSTKTAIISSSNGKTTINADGITAGLLDGKRIKADTIETTALTIGDVTKGTNNLTKKADWFKCTSTSELNNPTAISNCTLGKAQYTKYYTYTVDYTGDIKNNTEKVYIQADLKQFYNVTASKIYFKNKNSKTYYYKIKYSIDNEHWHDWNTTDDSWMQTKVDNYDYTINLNQTGVTARYFRLYLNGNETNGTSELSAWELYMGGATTCIDASGIITGKLNADRIGTHSIIMDHINITDNNFQFTNNNKVVFAIDGTDENNCSVTINPDTFTLGTTNGNAIVLENNKISINADYINAGKISADRIGAGTIDANEITVKNLSGSNIDAKGLTVYREENNKKINTFQITNQGQVVVDANSFLIRSGSSVGKTVEGLIDEYNQGISEYIKMEGNTITLGRTSDENTYKTVIDSDKLAFMYQNNTVAYISSQKMHINNAEIKEKLTIGRTGEDYYMGGFYDFTYRSNGHLTLKWRGE